MGLLDKILFAVDNFKIGKENLAKIQQMFEKYLEEKTDTVITRLRIQCEDRMLKDKGRTEFSEELQAQISELKEKEDEIEKTLKMSIDNLTAANPDIADLITIRVCEAQYNAANNLEQAIDIWSRNNKYTEVHNEILAKLIGD